ncbi:hypothetical protein QJS10_CPA01g01576 [Acorus calamus]|uniref:PB1 domain-containing protein n=1 Tax=Acorus calamus TaxID=4465 RepID=A0AAV9FR76_ACOCL|nr:hypothetical protein QJS10_CPA01g01576 [Acorus calamus]
MRLPMDPTPPTSYPDSVDSSPRSRGGDSWDEPPPSAAKLRLMCSYGGRIVPRPHDKSLCYVGGDTRIVVADRRSSLSDLSSKLSKTLLHGRAFTLKYQLPNEDLDSLISVATDEDLDNMIDEYDRTLASSPFKPSRLRLFLFPTKPDSASSAPPSLLDVSAKSSDSWFVDALNSSASLPRGLSSTSVDSLLLGLDGGGGGGGGGFAAAPSSASVEADLKQTASDSPMVMETGSSFGSASSGPSLSNLPPVRVRSDGVDDRSPPAAAQVGVEEYFAQMGLQRAEDHPPPPPPLMVVGGAPASVSPVENPNRVSSTMRGRLIMAFPGRLFRPSRSRHHRSSRNLGTSICRLRIPPSMGLGSIKIRSLQWFQKRGLPLPPPLPLYTQSPIQDGKFDQTHILFRLNYRIQIMGCPSNLKSSNHHRPCHSLSTRAIRITCPTMRQGTSQWPPITSLSTPNTSSSSSSSNNSSNNRPTQSTTSLTTSPCLPTWVKSPQPKPPWLL